MGLYQASFRVKHECPYRDISEGYPDVTIKEWYLNDCQVLEITSKKVPTDDLLEEIDGLGEALHKTVDELGLHVITQTHLCSLEDSILQRFEDNNCLYQPPTIYRHGWENYTVIAFDERDVRNLLDDLDRDRDIEVLSKVSISEKHLPHSMLAPVDQLFSGLTERQLGALRLALDKRYYEEPRSTSIAELSRETSVSRSTYEEHLRKAENKIITNAGQFLRLITGTMSENPLKAEQPGVKRSAD